MTEELNYAPFGYKISFRFDMPDGTPNGGFCDNPGCIPRVFEIVRELEGVNLVIRDETFYVKPH